MSLLDYFNQLKSLPYNFYGDEYLKEVEHQLYVEGKTSPIKSKLYSMFEESWTYGEARPTLNCALSLFYKENQEELDLIYVKEAQGSDFQEFLKEMFQQF
jgi:hypothetical protein